jgi:hypothetical protein
LAALVVVTFEPKCEFFLPMKSTRQWGISQAGSRLTAIALQWEVSMKFMKSLRAVLLGVVIAAATFSSVAPAFALGGCGYNRHRNAWGRCVWGGQNQDWCLRFRGHRATYVGNGVWRCFR